MTTMTSNPPAAAPLQYETTLKARKRRSLIRRSSMPAIGESFKKLNPAHMVRNPVMFVTEVGALVTTVEMFFARSHGEPLGFVVQITIWLWFTVLFANFAEAMAEGRGKAQANALRKSRTRHRRPKAFVRWGDRRNPLRAIPQG